MKVMKRTRRRRRPSPRIVAVIGQGFVGGSLTTVLVERGVRVFTHDKTGRQAPGGLHPTPARGKGGPRAARDIRELVSGCERVPGFSGIYFVCVPTPMFEDGAPDLSIVEGVLAELAAIPGRRTAVVKSTVPPGSTASWNARFGRTGLRVVFNPEFLTEQNALEDLRKQTRIVLGGPRPWVQDVRDVFGTAFPSVPVILTSSTEAELVKYMTNVHLMVRVVLSCELAELCDALALAGDDVDYDRCVEVARADPRLGGSHMKVPGQDGVRGARGHCFPKDLNALMHTARALGVRPTVMEAVWRKNLDVVPPEHRDWERMPGRAVSVRGGALATG